MQTEELIAPTQRNRYVPRKVAFSILGVGNTKGHDLINRGLIKAKKLDGKTIVELESVEAFLNSLPDARMAARAA
ncbi:hypothetical protein [Bradyrhizobium australiense]|uniref:DNA-binding protein n=1 Tax=Bradyrhizobium australiense TaxID=2721161 RepID=A0A7Y4GQW1_9BRAD|nr:hypothetical protein [Bradyrhizobium australiense]NOJ40314.1 hypothetical protein [Bradyrhizobium australiense]